MNDEEEARTIVEEIEFNRMVKRTPWGDQAILFRRFTIASRRNGVRKAEALHLIAGKVFTGAKSRFIGILKAFVNPAR